jgi:hypothetical protein
MDWLWVTVCRDVAGGVDWAKVREAATRELTDIGFHVETAREDNSPDPATWGLSPAAVEAQQRLLGMGGDTGDSGVG